MVKASCAQIKPRGKLGGGFGRQLYDTTRGREERGKGCIQVLRG